MLKDRGNIKWTSLMLPVHKDRLKEIYQARDEIEKPILDEQQLERLDILIKEAVRDRFTVKLSYYEDRRIEVLKGKLKIEQGLLYMDGKQLTLGNIIDIILI